MPTSEIDDLTARLAAFAAERDWDQFHSPKNLAAAMVVEAGEVLEHFQWRTEADSLALDSATKSAVALELADVLLYLVRLADKLDIDLMTAAENKMTLNAQRYPVALSRGSSKKYTDL